MIWLTFIWGCSTTEQATHWGTQQEFRKVVKLRPGFANGFDMLGLALEEI